MSASCRVVRRHLDALVDGELDGNVQVDFESHLAGCPICREHAAFSKAVKSAVKTELGAMKAPEHLRLRVLTAIESAPVPGAALPVSEPESTREPRYRIWMLPARYAVPAAAAAVLVVALGAQTDGNPAADAGVLDAQLLEDVVRRHSSEHPAEVQGPPHQVVGWFRGKLEFPARPVVFEEQPDARFVGARISNVNDLDAAAFFYEVRGHRVTVMVFDPPQRRLESVQVVDVRGRRVGYREVHGYHVPVVEHEGLTYAFTSDLDRKSMIQLAASARVAP